MTPLAIIFSAAFAGISLAMALFALLLRESPDRRPLCLPFVTLSCAQALFALNQVARNGCTDVVSGDVIARLGSLFVCIFAATTVLVYRRLLRPSTGLRSDVAIGVVFAALGLWSIVSPGGALFARIDSVTVIQAGWWGPISMLRGPPDEFATVLFAAYLATVTRMTWMTVTMRRANDRLMTVILLVPPFAFLIPIIHGYGLVQGWWAGVPLGEYGMATEFAALAFALHRHGRDVQRDLIRHQRQIEAVLEHGLGFAGLLDPTGRLVLANHTALRAAGTNEAAVIGHHFTETPWWRHDEQARRRLQAAIDRASAGEPDRFLTSHPLPDGTLIDVDFSLTPYRGPDGAIIYLIAEGRDISELRRMDRLMLESSKMQAVGQLAGGIAHDFNNVLCGIMGAAELALRRSQDPEMRKRLEVILSASGHAGDITRRLLAFARKGKVQQVPMRLNNEIEESLELFARSAGPNIRIERELLACPDVLIGDPAELQSAVLNLCLNARDAMPSGGTLKVTTTRQRLAEPLQDIAGHTVQTGSYLRIEVSDSGSGIPAEVLSRIFEPFFTTKPEGKGTGLGLPAVLGTAHAHGGGMLVQTTIGQGSTFTLLITAEEGVTPTALHAVQSFQAHGELVVLVDDNDQVRQQAGDLLTNLGFRVEAFGDPLKARQRLRLLDGVRCVLLDLEMPGLNGRDLYQEIRRASADLPVIISSGDAGNNPVSGHAEDPRLAILPKPWRLDHLQAVMLRLDVVAVGHAKAAVAPMTTG